MLSERRSSSLKFVIWIFSHINCHFGVVELLVNNRIIVLMRIIIDIVIRNKKITLDIQSLVSIELNSKQLGLSENSFIFSSSFLVRGITFVSLTLA